MWKKTLAIALTLVAATAISQAQGPDQPIFPGDQEPGADRWQQRRMQRMIDYLELSDSQIIEWQALLDAGTDQAPDPQQMAETHRAWREEFRQLAEQENPELERLGQIALDIFRAQEARRTAHQERAAELRTLLTPEQVEKLDALETAREFGGSGGRRGHHGPRHQRSAPESD